MSQKRIFISYRRSDSSGHAGRLYDYLKNYFGPQRIFFDVDTIPVGENFAQKINAELDNSDVVLVLIGNQWLDCRGADGNRRLDNPQDYVRLEVETALGKDIVVIPILLQGAQMPSGNALPETISDLSMRNAIRLNDDHWSSDCNLLAGILKKAINVPRSLKEQKARNYRSFVFALVALNTFFSILATFLTEIPAFWHLMLSVLLIFLPMVNVAFVTYLLGTIKKELDRLSWIIIGVNIVGGLMIAIGRDIVNWIPVTMIIVAGLLNFVEPDE